MTESSDMLLRRTFLACSVALVLAASLSEVWADEVVVVVNKDNPNPVDIAYIVKIYSGALRAWPDGSPVTALDQPEDAEIRSQFSQKVLNRSVANMRAVWSQNVFTGKGLPPRVVAPDAEVKRLISSNRNAVGYILASQVDASVKVVSR
jgi:ABC-type phosphate transport system substrate-binding protein